MTDIPFVVRLLPNNVVKAAFRVHLAPEALQHSRLQVGQVCAIIGEDGTRGAGIAWRAADKMGSSPKLQPAKVSETLCDTFSFKQGTQVRIEQSQDTNIRLASKLSLIDVTPQDWERSQDNIWKIRCMSLLGSCEAVAVGMSFDVQAEDRSKKRYLIEHIDSDHSQDSPSLYRIDDDTEFKILDSATSPSIVPSAQRPLHINASHIGGLTQQVEALNKELKALCLKAKFANMHSASSCGVLIHGYSGTGKSLLLHALAKTPGIKKVVKLGRGELLNSPVKNQSLISNAFHQALSSQPSLILIDRLDEVAPENDAIASSTVEALCTALDSVRSNEVLVVATARSNHTVNSDLLVDGRITTEIELPVPDLRGRVDILSSLLQQHTDPDIVNKVSAITHGYTGRDLARLVGETVHRIILRQVDEQGTWNTTDWSNVLSQAHSARLNDRSGSVATTLVERPSTPELNLTLADFEIVLRTIRPSALKEIIIEPPNITFADIGGSEGLHSRFDEIIKWPMEHPEFYGENYKTRRGILLYGPPGCSKTMTAQAVAKSYGLNFIAIRGAELISMYVGESERALRNIFRKARQAAPSIIFFDEIDSIAATRTSMSDSSKGLNVLTTLLNEMDGFEAAKNVLVLAATNIPESLDPAILRPGRFDEHIYLGPPDAVARKAILQICVNSSRGQVEVELDPLVAESSGMSGAEIRNAWNLAFDSAVKRAIVHKEPLKIKSNDVLAGIQNTPHGISAEMLGNYEAFARRATKLK